jgi:hypothetical protein
MAKSEARRKPMDRPSTALEIARQLRREADELLHGRGLDGTLKSYGRVFYTGSYALDAMAWPDVDINMQLEPDPASIGAFFEIGRKIAAIPEVSSMKFSNTFVERVEGWPEGLYWGIRLKYGDWPANWKIDIWAYSPEAYAENMATMQEILDAVDEEKRALICEIKQALLMPDGRTPILSGYRIYRAVLFEGLTELDDVKAYLREQGVAGV